MKRRVYTLDGYPEELIAVAFAKTSRSPEPFDKIVAELNEIKSREFHEKWVVGYGHSSVAEHAVIHLAVENVSRLAVEVIESTRLASFTEKSTRYQKISSEECYVPAELSSSKQSYLEAKECLFSVYGILMSDLINYYTSQNPELKKRAVGVKAMDSARFLLPNATLANAGITINARSLEHLLVKMLSNPLREVQEVGEEMKQAALKTAPTLIKYANENPYLVSLDKEFPQMFSGLSSSDKTKVKLISYDEEGVEKLIAALVYRYSSLSYEEALAYSKDLNSSEKNKILEIGLGGRGKYDHPAREFEHTTFTFDIIMDQGAYYEFKRHRMLSLSCKKPDISLGYRIPEDIIKIGKEKEFKDVLQEAEDAFREIENENPYAAGYIATNAHYRRVLVSMNLRELFHFIRLRRKPNAHFTIREIAESMRDELRRVHPELERYLLLEGEE
ncbi:FAD-dependent thymidylate synthase [Candidatus Micrarchaeota archaeon]|nr:FAD-dependent thymidylate synthase [Candidatus Micrarchaeota archaeon]